jgi:hypothetical protein
MKRMIRYTVKPDRAEENAGYVERVFGALARERPAGVRYSVSRLDDGVSFVHLVEIEDGLPNNPLRALPEFEAFLAGINDRCAEQPVTVTLNRVGAYP